MLWKSQFGSTPVVRNNQMTPMSKLNDDLNLALNSSKLTITALALSCRLPPARGAVLHQDWAESHSLLSMLHYQRLHLHVFQPLDLSE